jgi:hypothetical protein
MNKASQALHPQIFPTLSYPTPGVIQALSGGLAELQRAGHLEVQLGLASHMGVEGRGGGV